jgi:hypothetical protein
MENKMKLEKFDLEKALNGAKVVTSDGREIKELTKLESLEHYPLVGVVDGILHTWNEQGRLYEGRETNSDLFLAAEPQRIWVNVYHDNYGEIYAQFFRDETLAISRGKVKGSNYIKTIEITDEPDGK